MEFKYKIYMEYNTLEYIIYRKMETVVLASESFGQIGRANSNVQSVFFSCLIGEAEPFIR